jgi:hypothetical protein
MIYYCLFSGFQRSTSRSLILSEGRKDDSIQHCIEVMILDLKKLKLLFPISTSLVLHFKYLEFFSFYLNKISKHT